MKKEWKIVEEQLEKEFGGVYLLLDKGEVVYVGESNNVPRRIVEHRTSKHYNEYRILWCANRKEIEAALIALLRPKYNISLMPHEEKGQAEKYLDKEDAVRAVFDYHHSKYEPKICFGDAIEPLLDVEIRFPGQWVIVNEVCMKYGAYLGYGKYDLKQILLNSSAISKDVMEAYVKHDEEQMAVWEEYDAVARQYYGGLCYPRNFGTLGDIRSETKRLKEELQKRKENEQNTKTGGDATPAVLGNNPNNRPNGREQNGMANL